MTAPELKPCPFCGGNASISKDHDQDGGGAFYAVKCHKCRAKSSEIYAVETCNIHFTQVRDAWNRRADLAAVTAQVRKKFTVLGSGGASVDLQLVEDHGEQAKKNHYQTITRLAERGGLCWAELFAVLHNRPFQKIDTNEAMIACRALEARYLAALEPQPDPRDEVIARLVEAATHLCDGIATMLPPLGQSDRVLNLRAALAAAKAVQHG